MNQKKCPKCGEMNPGEAVMCWACYTPLTGAVGAGAAGGTATVAAPAVAVHDEKDQKKAIAPWQLGLVGVGLLLAVGFGLKTALGGSDPDASATAVPAIYPTRTDIKGTVGGVTNPGVAIPASPGNGGQGVPAVVPAKFLMVVAPNPDADWNVIGIVPADPNIDPTAAAAIGRFAKTMMNSAKPTQVYVFADRDTAQLFGRFQRSRGSQALSPADHASQTALWSRCLARYEFNGGRERVDYPSRNPEGWWKRGG